MIIADQNNAEQENRPETLMEMIMRFSPAVIALSLSFAMISSVSIGKRPDYQISPLSIEMQKLGDAALMADSYVDAIDYYQTALAVDPRNRSAYIAMARVVKAQGLKGKAIRYYSLALELDPNDLTALTEQGNLMLEKGAVEQARKNLARLQLLCRVDCDPVSKLAVMIAKAGEKPTLQASAVEIAPVIATNEEKSN